MRTTWQCSCRTSLLCAAAVAIAAIAPTAKAQSSQNAAAADRARVTANFAHVPLSFELNRGQAAAGVDALARGNGYTLQLGRGDATLTLAGGAIHGRSLTPADVLHLRLKGSQASPKVMEEGELTAKSNYFLGNDPAKWRTDIPNYARVRYEGIYPGIDLVYYGNGRALEHDFVVAPGADPAKIRFSIGGATSVRLDRQSGDLVLATGAGQLRLHKPVSYQTIAGKRTAVTSRYVLAKGGEVDFRLGTYNRSAPLVIDPELSYSTLVPPLSLGPTAVAVDPRGFSYLTGTNGSDVTVYKLSPGGSELVYTSIFGGSNYDHGTAIAVDEYGQAYVTGGTDSADFPILNAFQGSLVGASDAFVAKLNQAGNALVYSTYLGGGRESAIGITVDSAQRAYVTGSTYSTDFPTHLPIQAALKGAPNVYITALNQSGSTLLYSTYLGGSGSDIPAGIAIDPSNNVYVAGTTTSTDFPVKNALQPKNNNNQTISFTTGFLAKIYPTGPQLLYSTYLGGSLGETIGGVAADTSGNAYVAGQTASPDFPVANAYQSTGGPLLGEATQCPLGNYSTAFVSKFNPKGSALVYSTYLGQIEPDDDFPGVSGCSAELPLQNGATGIAVDSSGNAVVTGYTYSDNFPVTNESGNPGASGNCSTSAFITRFNLSGSALLYSSYFGGEAESGNEADICTGSGGTTVSGIALDPLGSAYIVGPPNAFLYFPLTPAAYELTSYGHYNWNYEAKFAFAPMAQTTTTLTTPYASINGSNTVILTAQVQPTGTGGAIPSGSVGFFVNAAQIGAATLNAQGIATLEYTFPTQGPYTVQANYSGNIDTDASTASVTKGFGITNVPGINPAGGTYHYEPTITMSDRLSGATIHYTLNGATANESSPVYTAPFLLTQSATISAIAVTPQTAPSAVVTATYVIDTPTATPVFSIPAGTYSAAQTVSIADATPGATIYYTVNGATPTTASTKYTAAIKVSASETIKAIAVAAAHETSATASATYTIK